MPDPVVHLVREGARLVSKEMEARQALERVVDDGDPLGVALARPGALVLLAEPAPTFAAVSVEAVSVLELLTVLVGTGTTGCVEVRAEGGSRRLYLEGGRFTGSASTLVEDRLGEVLWRVGMLSLDQVMIASAQVTAERKLGRILVELGFLNPADLRGALRHQAKLVFEACCLVDRGIALFFAGETNPFPIAFAEPIDALLDETLAAVAEVESILRTVGDLDIEVMPAVPAPEGRLDEGAQALLQLVTSRRGAAFTKRELVGKCGLGKKLGLKALSTLLVEGFLDEEERTPPVPERPLLERLCDALILVVEAMDKDGFAITDSVRDWLESPPPELAPALAAVKLDELSQDRFTAIAAEVPGGQAQFETALAVLLDFALFEAVDALPRDDGQVLSDQVRALGVL